METLEFSVSESLKKWLHMADWDLFKCGVFVEAFVSKVPQPLTSGCNETVIFFPHMQMICLHAVMWHFITKMDSYIPQGFSGFLPEILTAFCQFMVPTSHFSTVAERQETFNHWVWFSLSPLIFSTVLPVRASAWRDKHDRNVTSPSLVLSLINRACTSQSRFLLIIIISAQKWPCTASVQIMLDFTLIKDPSSPTLFGHFLIIHLEAEGND